MTLQQIVDIIKRLSHRGDTATTSSDGGVTQTILDCINIARKDIYLKIPKQWLRVTSTLSVVQGTSTYDLAADVLEPYLFRFTVSNSDRFLTKVADEKDFYKRVFTTSGSQNIPAYYFDAGLNQSTLRRQIIMSPTPDRSITVNYTYYKLPTTEMLTTSDLSAQVADIPAVVHNAVWKGGLYYFLKVFDDPAQGVAKQDFAEALAQIDILEEVNLDDDTAFQLNPMSVKRV